MKWAKVDQSGRIIEIVDSDREPQPQAGFTFRKAAEGQQVGDSVENQSEQSAGRQR